jgi:hypothetical protein
MHRREYQYLAGLSQPSKDVLSPFRDHCVVKNLFQNFMPTVLSEFLLTRAGFGDDCLYGLKEGNFFAEYCCFISRAAE